jgi:hypothetical protein
MGDEKMILTHSLNLQESKTVFNRLEPRIKRHMCYNNIWTVVNRYNSKFTKGEWKVAYGYIRIFPKEPLMARHCFIVDSKGNAIDLTIFRFGNYRESEEYLSFAILNKQEYLECLLKDRENDPSLKDYFMLMERNVLNWANQEGLLLIS